MTLGCILSLACRVHNRADAYKPYSSKDINDYVQSALMRSTGYYGATDGWLYEALDRYGLTNKTVLIVGK